MERLVVQRRPEVKLHRGRSPTRWTDLVTTLLGENFAAATRDAADRRTWRRTVQRVLQHLDGWHIFWVRSHHASATKLDSEEEEEEEEEEESLGPTVSSLLSTRCLLATTGALSLVQHVLSITAPTLCYLLATVKVLSLI